MTLFLSIINKLSKDILKQSGSAIRDLKVVENRWYNCKGRVDYVFYQQRLIVLK